MALNPLSPGVYIQEIPVFPASIAGVATAIPVFIGYVEKAESNGIGIPFFTPVRITSLLEFQTQFGQADGQDFDKIEIHDNTNVNPVQRTFLIEKNSVSSRFRLYYNLQMYFANGGGPCWIVPLGLYSSVVSMNDMLAGLDASGKVDEPTLILFPDIFSLGFAQQKAIHDAALEQCELLKDRFVIMDVVHTNLNTVKQDSDDFRDKYVGTDNLKYGAAYYPDLNSVLNYGINQNLLHITAQKQNGIDIVFSQDIITFLNETEVLSNNVINAISLAKIAIATKLSLAIDGVVSSLKTDADTVYADANTLDTTVGVGPYSLTITAASAATTAAIAAKTAAINFAASPTDASLATILLNSLSSLLTSTRNTSTVAYTDTSNFNSSLIVGSLNHIQSTNPSVYNSIIQQIDNFFVTVNPSGAMVGIYARVDNDRGVWKAPANVGIFSIIGPSINITTSEQDGLNIDATSGKSINAIRSFTGKGTLVWGARTLDGNDNEWRYINVRRLFIYMEESIKNATEFVVFEGNVATTWLRVRGMIEAFLTELWRDGALAGATTKDAFFVHVGLGTTMTAQDILEGRMIVEVGVAAVRPAEFIILRFMHKLQES